MNNSLFKDNIPDLNKGNYNYAEKIKWPVDLGVQGYSKGFFGSMDPAEKNINALMYYSDALLFGNHSTGVLGNEYDMQIGYCAEKSKDGSKINFKPKIVKFDNKPSGKVNVSQIPPSAFGKQLRGIVPGLIENINKIDPMGFWNALSGKTKCNENFDNFVSKNITYTIFNNYIIFFIIIFILVIIYYIFIKKK